ncbi:cytokine-induced anti-apoptosis inhibitor 1, Fe-S biogenesis-domain-containing protein [Catenaria anguillulae PL171]|uniref:Cytokine-induced anti-apoptosis inhibitor 1, Fe-S biogenesis-domain-containing protein n=1 Tax=Catenaria anguillulae PL171 TaxID=765915 RepID=A0A1Y2HU60_9FUNG|nr:cytokine-induced anti-apoptosis inhibitor 1, Fe-S biogenesis-domain-containing protein [Catenaria anguillulae PL171]
MSPSLTSDGLIPAIPANADVLFVGNANASPSDIAGSLGPIKAAVSAGSVAFEQLDRIPTLNLKHGTHSHVISGYANATIPHSTAALGKLLYALRAGGLLLLKEVVCATENSPIPVESVRSVTHLASHLKLAGFVDVQVATKPLSSSEAESVLSQWGVADGSTWSNSNTWASAMDSSTNDELIDEDALLDEDDLVKPAKELLSQPSNCETKRKACKNCSCGRAEMEAAEERNAVVIQDTDDFGDHPITNVVPPTVKSSCGNCYLGDAFRCSSCPYLGMPAFKPGEKVVLAGNLMQDDVEF